MSRLEDEDYQQDVYGFRQLYSDLYKDVYGFRPRGPVPFETFDEYQRVMADLQEDLRVCEEEAVENAKRRIVAWEAHIQRLVDDHRIDRATAIKWDMDAMDTDEFDFYEYCWGVPYGTVESRKAA